MTFDLTIPVSIAVFFVGAILLVRYALPRLDTIQKVRSLEIEAKSNASFLGQAMKRCDDLDGRLATAETNIKTLHGNMVTIRDQNQFKALAGTMRGVVAPK